MLFAWSCSNNPNTDLNGLPSNQSLIRLAVGRHHSDRGTQYVSVACTNRLNDTGIKPSVGTIGDPYDNGLAETINGLYKTELVYNLGPWKSTQALELTTLIWVHWYNQERLLGAIDYVPPAEYEKFYNLSELQHTAAA